MSALACHRDDIHEPIIDVRCRGRDWHACLDTNQALWEAGATGREAITKLRKSHPQAARWPVYWHDLPDQAFADSTARHT